MALARLLVIGRKNMNSNITHNIKHRQYANDEFMTPLELAKSLSLLLPNLEGKLIIEPCPGQGAFIQTVPGIIGLNQDFYTFNLPVNWIITNPPYSDLNHWLKHSFELATDGVALLVGLLNITPKRMELANSHNFGLTQIHLCKVFHWFGISAFCIWERGKSDIVSYDRVVWR